MACITPENLHSPWIHFEAGAIRGNVNGPICAVLIGVPKGELRGPLGAFQAVEFAKEEEMHKLLVTLARKPPSKVEAQFRKHWPDLRDYDVDPVAQLFGLQQAHKAPYLLARAAELSQSAKPDLEKHKALRELVDRVRRLQTETLYLREATEIVAESNVWAVCGQKSVAHSKQFLAANSSSKHDGNHIERLFFPPRTPEERASIHQAIQVHIAEGMAIHVFPDHATALRVRCQFNLPVGFGMTLMGPPGKSRSIPTTLHAVLIHWGGVGIEGTEHHGVILRHPLWTRLFAKLFGDIKAQTSPMRCRSFDTFLRTHPHYA